MFQTTQAMITTVIQARNVPVPRNRAIRSEKRPSVSWSTFGLGSARRGSRGTSRRDVRRLNSRRSTLSSSRAMAGLLRLGLLFHDGSFAPVLGKHVVEDVVDRDDTQQVAILVGDGAGDEVVRGEQS